LCSSQRGIKDIFNYKPNTSLANTHTHTFILMANCALCFNNVYTFFKIKRNSSSKKWDFKFWVAAHHESIPFLFDRWIILNVSLTHSNKVKEIVFNFFYLVVYTIKIFYACYYTHAHELYLPNDHENGFNSIAHTKWLNVFFFFISLHFVLTMFNYHSQSTSCAT
jgi:hypothetical protein